MGRKPLFVFSLLLVSILLVPAFTVGSSLVSDNSTQIRRTDSEVTSTSQGLIDRKNIVPDQTQERIITYAMPYDFSEYSQFAANSYATAQWMSAVMNGLYERNQISGAGYTPVLASGEPSVSSNGLVWTVDLRSNLKFASGGSLTAEDVVFSYQVALTPDINTNSYWELSTYLENDSIIALDADTIQFTFSSSNGFLQNLLTQGIIEKSVFETRYNNCVTNGVDCVWNSPDGSDALGAGPFMVESIDNINNIVTLVKNQNYYESSLVVADKLIFKKIADPTTAISEMNAGNIDILDTNYAVSPGTFDSNNNVKEIIVDLPVHQEIALNHYNGYYGNGSLNPGSDGDAYSALSNETALEVRKAMSHIVNRQGIIDNLLGGLGRPASTAMPAGSLGWDPALDARKYNLTKAQMHMEAAGWDYSILAGAQYDAVDKVWENMTESFFSITVLAPNTNPERNTWSFDYSQELPNIGIGVNSFENVGWDLITPRTLDSPTKPLTYAEGGFDILFIGYSWDLDWKPYDTFSDSGYCGTGSCINFMNYDNYTVEQISDEYNAEIDFDARMEKAKMLQAALHTDIPVIPILSAQSNWEFSSEMKGINYQLLEARQYSWDGITKETWPEVGINYEVTHSPTVIYETNSPEVRASIGVEHPTEVILSYSVNGNEYLNISMVYDLDGNYTASIPQQDIGASVTYKIYILTSHKAFTTQEYSFEVVSDFNPPEIISVTEVVNPTSDAKPVVSAEITDDTSVEGAWLSYNAGDGWTNVTMEFSDGFWVGEIPNFPDQTNVDYRVFAADPYGLESQSELFSYTVVDTNPGDTSDDSPGLNLPILGLPIILLAMSTMVILVHKTRVE